MLARDGRTCCVCRSAVVGDMKASLGDIVTFEGGQQLGLVQAMWQSKDGKYVMQIRKVLKGLETVLGDAAAIDELFVTTELTSRYGSHRADCMRHFERLELVCKAVRSSASRSPTAACKAYIVHCCRRHLSERHVIMRVIHGKTK